MKRSIPGRVASRLRQSLGVTELTQRLDTLDQRLLATAQLARTRGPVYFGDHTVLLATQWGAKMLVDTRDGAISPWIALDGLWETHATGWLQGTLRPGHVFVDVGANVGYFTLLAGTIVGHSGAVVAIEPVPRAAELLQRNVVMNGMHGFVKTWQRAAWSESAALKFNMRHNLLGSSSFGSAGSEALALLVDTEEIIEVTAVPLDDLLDDMAHVDVVKVDVEGAEARVFVGMARTLARNPDVAVVFEWAPALMEAVGDAPETVLDLLEDQGMKFRLLERDLAPVGRGELLELVFGNVVATR